jgi:hypothetical protein
MPVPRPAHQVYPCPSGENTLIGPVARRHVIYIQGFFPQGPAYYHAILKKQCAHHAQLHKLDVECSDLAKAAPLIWRCKIEASKEGRCVQTVYDFFDWHDIACGAHEHSFFYNLPRTMLTFFTHFTDGTFPAMWRLFWKFAIAWVFPYLLFVFMALLSALAVHGAWKLYAGEGAGAGVEIILSALAVFGLLQLDKLYWCAVMLRTFNYASAYAKGRKPELEQRVEQFSQAIEDICKTSDADEILIVGHSFGGQLAWRAAAGAYRKGAFAKMQGRAKLLTLGDAGLHVALMRGPGASRIRHAVFDLAAQKDLPWVIAYSAKDVMSFNDVDPPSALKHFEGDKTARVEDFTWPLMLDARLRGALPPKDYRAMRWRFFHMHSFFIMAARLRSAPFDYLRLVCGAQPLALSGERISAK